MAITIMLEEDWGVGDNTSSYNPALYNPWMDPAFERLKIINSIRHQQLIPVPKEPELPYWEKLVKESVEELK